MSYLQAVIADATSRRIMRKSTASPAHDSAGNLHDRVTQSAHSGQKTGSKPEYHGAQSSVLSKRTTIKRRDASPRQQGEKQAAPANEPESKMAATPPGLKQRQKPESASGVSGIKPPTPETPWELPSFQGARKKQIGEGGEQRIAQLKHSRPTTKGRTSTKHELTSQQNEISVPAPPQSMDETPFDSARLRSHQFFDEQEMGGKAGSSTAQAGGEHVAVAPVEPAAMDNDSISAERSLLSTPDEEPQLEAALHAKPIRMEKGEPETDIFEERKSVTAAQFLDPERPAVVYAHHSDSRRSGFSDQQKSEPGKISNIAEKAYPEHDGALQEQVRQEKGGATFQQPVFWSTPPPPQQDTPRVQIGQVDVIVEAPHAPQTRSAPTRENDFASRHFLRRL